MRISKITDAMLVEAVEKSFSVMEVLRYLGIKEAGGSHSHYQRRILKLGLDTSHFQRYSNTGKISTRRRTADDILQLRSEGGRAKAKHLTRALIESGVAHCCSECGQGPEWKNHPLTLDVDHINENWLDDRIENLRFLCPNCHSQYSRKLKRE